MDARKAQQNQQRLSVGSQFVQDGAPHSPLNSMERFQQLVASGMTLLVLFSVVSLSGQGSWALNCKAQDEEIVRFHFPTRTHTPFR